MHGTIEVKNLFVDNFQYSFFEASVTVGGLYIYVILRNHR